MDRMPKPHIAATLAPLLAVLLQAATPAQAAPGALDPAFGLAGVASPTDRDHGTSHYFSQWLALQPDGKLALANYRLQYPGYALPINGVTASWGGALRLLPNAIPDQRFGSRGQVLGPAGFRAKTALVQPDGKILLAGSAAFGRVGDFVMLRVNPNGSPDSSFGSNGMVTTPLQADTVNFPGTTWNVMMDAALLQDGRILVLSRPRGPGLGDDEPASDRLALLRYLPDGRLDSSFNGSGIVNHRLNNQLTPFAMAEQADGKIVVAGSTYLRDARETRAFIGRINADGSLDTGFGEDGILVFQPGTMNSYEVHAVALQPDGKILFAASDPYADWMTNTLDTVVGRLNPDGQLDAGFGEGGLRNQVVQTASGLQRPWGSLTMALQPDGRILLAAETLKSGETPLLLRLLPDGSTDTGFGQQGKLDFPSLSQIDSLLPQPDGKLLVGGYSGFDDRTELTWLFRLLANDRDDNGVTEPWDLAPDRLVLRAPLLPRGAATTTSMATIQGLGAGVQVPVSVSNGEYALNGSSHYRSGLGYVGNGDRINLRFASGSYPRLLVGGMHAGNNSALILGPRVTAEIVFEAATNAPALKVMALQPQAGASRVPRARHDIRAVFGNAIDPASLDAGSFTLACNGTAVAATPLLLPGERIARLLPLLPLPAGAQCSATLGTTLRDRAGNTLSSPLTWTFTLQ